jgi:hypothetical protein
MSKKRFYFYLTFIVLLGGLGFFWIYLLRYEKWIERGFGSPLELIGFLSPFCGLATLAVFLLSLLHFHLLQLVLGKDLKEIQTLVLRYGTLGFALLVEAAFLILFRNMGADFLAGIAYTITSLAFAVFAAVFFTAKFLGSNRFEGKKHR